jgi:FtsZ-binding cell division protein ZapB
LAPDQVALAIAAVGQIEAEIRMLAQQWALKRERARYEAERARRQYDTVEPENRLVARSLERVWEEKLRGLEGSMQTCEVHCTIAAVASSPFAGWKPKYRGRKAASSTPFYATS